MGAPLGDGVDEIHPQKSLMKISGLDSVGECARQQDISQQSEENLRQHLESTGIHRVMQNLGERGCGLRCLASKIREHYNDESNRHNNKLPVRLIGSQAITLARYSYRLVDTLECDNETVAQKVQEKLVSI